MSKYPSTQNYMLSTKVLRAQSNSLMIMWHSKLGLMQHSVPKLPLVWRALFAAARAGDVVRHLQREAEVNLWAEQGPAMLEIGY